MEILSPESQTQQNQIPENQNSGKPKRKYWKFILGFLGIIVIVGGGFFVWERYLSPQAKSNRETQKNYEKYLAWEENYKKAMTEDTYGGKTPEETLKMFIEALKKKDIDLASKYFALNTNENSEYYLTRREWEEGLRKAKEEGRLGEVTKELETAKLTETSSQLDTAWFTIYDTQKEIKHEILLEFNKYSSVWKIESM